MTCRFPALFFAKAVCGRVVKKGPGIYKGGQLWGQDFFFVQMFVLFFLGMQVANCRSSQYVAGTFCQPCFCHE